MDDRSIRALKTYREKRNFDVTPEPAEGGVASPDAGAFVIQKHWATRLHYDLRLELDGTMMSWAVPKGPSFDPADKRMAVHVEDHPISYNQFEGTIPPKQYGAGKVIIWDKGVWLPVEDPRRGMREGKLKFELRGHKMQGRWTLVRMKGRPGERQEAWLLIKEKDEHARPASEYSVVDEMPDSVKALPDRPADPAADTVSDAAAPVDGPPPGARKAALPASLQPELATLVDGYRVLTRAKGGRVKLFTRNGNDWTARMPQLARSLEGMELPDGWYDGEIIMPGDRVPADFQALQGAFDSDGTADIVYSLFDVPFCAGYDLRKVPLPARREVLRRVVEHRPSPQVRLSSGFEAAAAAPAPRARKGQPGASSGRGADPAAAAVKLPTSLRVSHPDRVIDARSGTTKIELVRYYALVAPLMMAHLKARPVALVRAPSGVGGEMFFQKHAERYTMNGIEQLDPALSPDHKAMLEVARPAGLLSAAQMNVIEFHTWNAVKRAIGKPDRMTFDLDPGEGIGWPEVREGAQLVRTFLAELGLPAYLKTSGGKGLHIVVPLKKRFGWDEVKDFSRAIVQHLAETIPERFVLKSGPKNRVGKIFIDYLRNGFGATTVCAWSARARPGLGISVPVSWDELPGLEGGAHWSVPSVAERIAIGNEPWRDYEADRAPLRAAMKRLGFEP